MGGLCSEYSGGERCVQGFVWEHEEMGPLERPKFIWEGNIMMDIQEVWWKM